MTVYGHVFLDSATHALKRFCSQESLTTFQATDLPYYADSVSIQNARVIRS